MTEIETKSRAMAHIFCRAHSLCIRSWPQPWPHSNACDSLTDSYHELLKEIADYKEMNNSHD